MNPIIRNVLAVIVGSFVAMFVNGSIISLGGEMLPVPEGIDPNDIESIKANIDRYTAVHFISPFLAHALGSLVGAIIACLIGASRQKLLALIVVGLHFIGGLMMAVMLDFQPLGFTVVDLLFAYFPMGLLAWKMTGSKH